MTLAKNILGAGAWILLCMLSHIAFAEGIKGYQGQVDQVNKLYKDIQIQNTQITELQNALNKKGVIISNLKNEPEQGFLPKIQLQKKMKEAQTLSVQLDQRYIQRSQIQDQLVLATKNLLRSIESDLSKAHLLGKNQTSNLMHLHEQVSKLTHQSQNQNEPLITLSPAPEDESTSSSMEQWIVLQDLQLYTQDLIDQTVQELAYEKQQKVLRKELTHLMNEETFFGEQGFIQGTARKQTNSAATAATTSENQDSETDPEIDPEEPDVETDPEVPVDGEEVPVDPLDPSMTDDLVVDEPVVEDVISPSFEDIDPKIQPLTFGSIFSENTLQDSSSAGNDFQRNFKIQNNTGRDNFLQNPNDIANAIISLSPHAGESKEAFLNRKVQYLNDILKKLENNATKVKSEIESTVR